ncbi:MAG TPA: hypothetical protein VGC77_00590 [Rhodopseudomonas sp.]|uniref:hypothetical protein n=1 Tax=Rhodopseudomonas sp. TaxID=1078 RepID=UPI002ED80676
MPLRNSHLAAIHRAGDDGFSWSMPRPETATRGSVWLGALAFWIVVAGLITARILFLDPAKTTVSTDSRTSVETSVASKF